MRILGEAIALVILYVTIMSVFFVFTGEPDLWDKYHTYLMGV